MPLSGIIALIVPLSGIIALIVVFLIIVVIYFLGLPRRRR